MDVYLITVDDHQKSMKKYYICVTKNAADMLFKKIIEENYFDFKKDMKEDLKKHVTTCSGNLRMGILLHALNTMH